MFTHTNVNEYDDMSLEEVINTIKERRFALGVTQESVASLSGVNLRTIKEFESGRGNPTFATLSKIADVLGMEIKMEVRKV